MIFNKLIQRATQGWTCEDTWELDKFLARIIRDTITHLVEHKTGYPERDFRGHPQTMESHREDLLKVADAFNEYLQMDDLALEWYQELEKKEGVPSFDELKARGLSVEQITADPKNRLSEAGQKAFHQKTLTHQKAILKKMRHLFDVWGSLWN
jgi:hypothetical protein